MVKFIESESTLVDARGWEAGSGDRELMFNEERVSV